MVVVESTDLFVGALQVVRVTAEHTGSVHAHVEGEGLRSARHGADQAPGPFGYEVLVDVSAHAPGTVLPARLVMRSGGETTEVGFSLAVAEPGWTVHLVSAVSPLAFDVVRAHVELALADPAYRFTLPGGDFLRPYLDTRPEDRPVLRALAAQGRLELVARPPSGAGWRVESETLVDAERGAYARFRELKGVAATRDVVLPVGTGVEPPSKWVTQLQHDWNSRYTSPRFVCSLPRDVPVAARPRALPVPDGIDVQQARRAAEDAVSVAERFAPFVTSLAGTGSPALVKARSLLAHWSTGRADPDLLAGLREAYSLGSLVRDGSLRALTSIVDTYGSGVPVVVWNPSEQARSGVVEARLPVDLPGVRVVSADGEHPCVHEGHSVVFHAGEVLPLGWKVFHLVPGSPVGWTPGGGTQIANSSLLLTVDPARGGGVVGLVRLVDEVELIADGGLGNELVVSEDVTSGSARAGVSVWHSPVGERAVVRGRVGAVRYTQILTLWEGVDRVECVTSVDDFTSGDVPTVRWVWGPADLEAGVPGQPLPAVVGVAGSGRLGTSGSLVDAELDQDWLGRDGMVVPETEVAQPVCARYWRHGQGAAPLGGLPVGVSLRDASELLVVSDREDVRGRVRLVVPPGWSVTPDEVPFDLPAGGFLRTRVRVDRPRGAAPGRYPVRARVDPPFDVEDVAFVDVPEWGGMPDDGPVAALWFARPPEPVRVAAGGRVVVPVEVASSLWGAIAVEVRLVSPWGTWDALRPYALGGEVPARGRARFEFTVAPPRWTAPGRWWLVAKVAGAGLVHCSPAVTLEIVE